MRPAFRLASLPIKRQVVVCTIALVLPLGVAVLWGAQRALAERRGDLRDEAASVASTTQAYLDQYLQSIDALAGLINQHPDVRMLRREACDRLFARALAEQPLIQNVVLVAADGSLRGSGLAPTAGQRDAPAVFPYVADVVRTGRPLVAEFTRGAVTSRPTIVLAYPVRDEAGALIGVLGFDLNLARLQAVFATIPLPEGSVITLTDRSSRVLATSLDPEREIGSTTDAEAVDPKNASRAMVQTGTDGVDRVFGTTAIERGPWLLSVGIPTRVATARAFPMWRRSVFITTFWTLAALAVGLFLADRVSRPVSHLKRIAQRIAAGDLSPPTRVNTPALEFAELQDAFIRMAADLRETRDALDQQIDQERRMREVLQSLQRQVVRQERLAAVGQLVSGVAHELNNPLQAILGTAEVLEGVGGLHPEALEEVALIKTQSGRAREIIRNLSRFASQQSGPPSLVGLRHVIAEVVQLRRRALENLAISLDVDVTSMRPVFANFTELEQVLLNFIINAEHAIEDAGQRDGRILIRLYDAGKRVRLEVLDNGSSVKPEDEPKLFQPFFTTKPAGKGTGLGLSVSYGIIDSLGGVIGYLRNEWGGATFFFELPAADTE